MSKQSRIGRFHVLTDTVLQDRFTHKELAEMAIEGGADVVQYRQKTGQTLKLVATAIELRNLCLRRGVLFVVNDRLDVAQACEALAIHLGRADFPITMARRILGPEVIIGGSATTVDEALEVEGGGADYIGFGPIYATGSKADAAPPTGVEGLAAVVNRVHVPIIAIGGIDPDNVLPVMEAGAYGIAVISSVCCQPDPAAATRELAGILAPFVA